MRTAKVTLSLVCLLAVAAAPAQALTVRKQEFTCPIGGEKFTASVVGSYTQFGMRLDTRPIGAMLSPIPFPVCPGNGFVMYKTEFTPDELKTLAPIVTGADYKTARKENSDYYMVAFMRERLGATPIELARLYLRASWESEGSYASDPKRKPDRPELVARYRALALEKYDAFLKQDASYSREWWTAAILACELERLLGHFDAAAARLDKLPIDKLGADAPERRAIDQIRTHAASKNAQPERFEAKKK